MRLQRSQPRNLHPRKKLAESILDQAPRPERLNWVDTARGIGIILVVYGHALRGHVTAGAFDPAWHADMQDAVIYSFHMPLFFFLAGLFVRRSLSKGAGIFLREKAVTLVYPYFLWSVVSVALAMLAAGAVNSPKNADAMLTLWQTPVFQYWFLYALALCQLVALLSRADWRITGVLCGVSAAGFATGGFGMLTIAISFYVYFGAGMLFAPYLPALQQRSGAVCVAAVFSMIAFVLTYLDAAMWPDRMLVVARALLGIIATVSISMLCAPWSRWLALLGTASMAIFVLHTIFSAGLRISLHAVGYSNNLVAMVLGTLIGIAGPLAVWAVARRYGLLQWLGLGASPRIGQERAA
jgi:fucose 4-O-acetylase-like acetyltransferase